MARVEENDTEKKKDGELRAMIQSEVRKGVRRGLFMAKLRGCIGCLFIFILFTFGTVGSVLYGVAKTGLVRVPLLSRSYREPSPTRIVMPAATTLTDSLERELRAQMRRGSGPFTLTVKEEELTRAVRDLTSGATELPLADAQIAALPGELELFARITWGSARSTLMVRIVPSLEQGALKVRVRRAELGQLPIWHRLVDAVVQGTLGSQLKEINRMLGAAAQLERVTVSPGRLEITGTLAPPSSR